MCALCGVATGYVVHYAVYGVCCVVHGALIYCVVCVVRWSLRTRHDVRCVLFVVYML